MMYSKIKAIISMNVTDFLSHCEVLEVKQGITSAPATFGDIYFHLTKVLEDVDSCYLVNSSDTFIGSNIKGIDVNQIFGGFRLNSVPFTNYTLSVIGIIRNNILDLEFSDICTSYG